MARPKHSPIFCWLMAAFVLLALLGVYLLILGLRQPLPHMPVGFAL